MIKGKNITGDHTSDFFGYRDGSPNLNRFENSGAWTCTMESVLLYTSDKWFLRTKGIQRLFTSEHLSSHCCRNMTKILLATVRLDKEDWVSSLIRY